MEIEKIKKLVSEQKIKWSEHCLARMGETVYFITAYIPDIENFKEDLKTRRI